MRTLIIIVLVCGSTCLAQTAAVKPTSKPKPHADTELKSTKDQLARAEQTIADFKASNDATAQKLSEALTMLRILDKESKYITLTDDDQKAMHEVPRGEILDLGASIENGDNRRIELIQKLGSENESMLKNYNSLVDRFNELRQTALNQIDQANARVARANQINNAMAMYALMPRYNPPPIQIYQPSQPVRLQTNCSSQSIGTFTYTNCY